MAKQPDQCFIRQRVISSEKIGIAIPQSATIFPEYRQLLITMTGVADPPPNSFLFHYLDLPLDDQQLDDGAMIATHTHEFLVRDAAIRVFDLLASWDDEFCWSFCSTSQIIVIVAVKIGEMIDVRFDQEFERVFHVKLYNMSSGVPNSGHGQYAVDLAVHNLNERTRNEFRVKVVRDNGFWVQGSLRPWENPGNICAAFLGCTRRGGSPWTRSRSR